MDHIDIYTDGSQKQHYLDNVVFVGYLVVRDSKEYYDVYHIGKKKLNSKLPNSRMSSTSAEYFSILISLEECLKYTNTSFNIYTDSLSGLSAFDITYDSKSSSKVFKNTKLIFNNLVYQNTKLGNTINVFWVESHNECWGNLKIDNIINRFAYKYILDSGSIFLKSTKISLKDKIKHLDSVL